MQFLQLHGQIVMQNVLAACMGQSPCSVHFLIVYNLKLSGLFLDERNTEIKVWCHTFAWMANKRRIDIVLISTVDTTYLDRPE
jgi:hypothetical protein